MEEEKESDGSLGCAYLVLLIIPGAAGIWLMFGPAWGLLSIPAWTLFVCGVDRVFNRSKDEKAEESQK